MEHEFAVCDVPEPERGGFVGEFGAVEGGFGGGLGLGLRLGWGLRGGGGGGGR